MTPVEIEEKLNQANSLLMLLGIKDSETFMDYSDDWEAMEDDLMWFHLEISNRKHLYDVMKMFEPLGLNPYVVPDTQDWGDGEGLETVYLRLSTAKPHYNTPAEVWPVYRPQE